ncbi:DUF3987 domain-containing protein [Hymenobacter sp. BT491]|uniref:DUF3987 domain-containing protein n=1 Tax=Hymenobacter sp. BT491 TaxID=2766779 RepID=UPI00165380AB|nr:DUF3987 domain-containing protein [Hymenobacter sp. BT491]MBC6992276.1 DUF3987 domain-containing protein [Hymenobacter sp. BT491]
MKPPNLVMSYQMYFSYFTGGIQNIYPLHQPIAPHFLYYIIKKRGIRKTEELRALPIHSPARNKVKHSLDYITPGGIFTKRAAQYLVSRSGIIVLDFDHVPNLRALRKVMLADPILGPSIALLFKSPSGDGLKVFVVTDTTLEHELNFKILVQHLTAYHPKWIKYLDTQACDIARACFIPHDPDVYLNQNEELTPAFPTDHKHLDEQNANVAGTSSRPHSGKKALADTEAWVKAVELAGGFPDRYASWVQIGFAFASLGEIGREYFHRVSRVSPKYNRRECEKKFSGLLKDYDGRTDIGSFFGLCKKAGILPSAQHLLTETPIIPNQVYGALPKFLQSCCQPFAEGRERDVMLTSTLGILSGCFPTVIGLYDGSWVGTNLYSFIVAPAASGKSAMKWAYQLAYPLHTALVKERIQADKGTEEETPCLLHQLYLPANNSAAGLIKALADNEGRGIVCETEADTLSATLKQDWGNFSDLLRKAFHHEPYTYQRKTGEYYDLANPKLSIVLTGTPGQVTSLILSAEDGLFSRFLYYTFNAPPRWRDVGPKNGLGDLSAYFDKLAAQVSLFAAKANKKTIISLSEDQWQTLNTEGEIALASAIAELGDDVASVVKRWGLMTFRLAMLLTLIRGLTKKSELPETIRCNEQDFATALSISSLLREHAYVLFESMPVQGNSNTKLLQQEQRVALRAQAIDLKEQGLGSTTISKKLGIPRQTIVRWTQNN